MDGKGSPFNVEEIKHRIDEVADTIISAREHLRNSLYTYLTSLDKKLAPYTQPPTLEDTLVEKIGGGPHGYGDPDDTSLRKEEDYLYPRMLWRNIRYEKCASVIDAYYACIYDLNAGNAGKKESCTQAEKRMFECKAFYYSPAELEKVEEEVTKEYIKLRSKFRQTGSEEDLWQLKMLMLEPYHDKVRKVIQEREGKV